MKVVCIQNLKVDGLTLGNQYDVLDLQVSYVECKYLINNDRGETIWHDRSHYNILKLIPSTGIWAEYVGPERGPLTIGKKYLLLDRDGDGINFDINRDRFYVLDDKLTFRHLPREHVNLKQYLRELKLKELGI